MKENLSYVLIFILAMTGMLMYSNKNPKVYAEKVSEDTYYEGIDSVSLIRTTYYNATVDQCDTEPFVTADGSKINIKELDQGELKWVALSQDLIKDEYKAGLYPGLFNGKFSFGDTIHVYSEIDCTMNGDYVVRDVMNSRYRKSMDFLLPVEHTIEFSSGNDFKIIRKQVCQNM